jgi:hypothetical protein
VRLLSLVPSEIRHDAVWATKVHGITSQKTSLKKSRLFNMDNLNLYNLFVIEFSCIKFTWVFTVGKSVCYTEIYWIYCRLKMRNIVQTKINAVKNLG